MNHYTERQGGGGGTDIRKRYSSKGKSTQIPPLRLHTTSYAYYNDKDTLCMNLIFSPYKTLSISSLSLYLFLLSLRKRKETKKNEDKKSFIILGGNPFGLAKK